MFAPQLDRLRSCRFLRSADEVAIFETGLQDLCRRRDLDQAVMEDLFILFEDSAVQQDVLWGLLHCIEDLDSASWISAFVTVLPVLKDKSPEWVDTITARILNGGESRKLMETLLQQNPTSRLAILPVVRDFESDDDPQLQGLRRNAGALLKGLDS